MTQVFQIIIFAFFTLGTVEAQIPNSNFHTNEHLYKDFEMKVKKCEIRTLNKNGEYHCPLMNNKNQDLIYDENGLLVERISYDCLGYADSLETKTIWKYIYADGVLLEVIGNDYKTEEVTKKWYYRIENDSTSIKCSIKGNNDTIPSSKIVKRKSNYETYILNNLNEYYLKFNEEFDKDGRTVSVKNFDESNNLKYLKIVSYDKDSLGRKIEYTHSILPFKNRIDKTISIKNDKDDAIERIHLTDKGELKAEHYFDYKYDKFRNWTKRTTRWRRNKNYDFIIHTTEREITYY